MDSNSLEHAIERLLAESPVHGPRIIQILNSQEARLEAAVRGECPSCGFDNVQILPTPLVRTEIKKNPWRPGL